MYIKNKINLRQYFVISLILVLIFFSGLYYSDTSSYGAGFYPNIIFFMIGIIYVIVCFFYYMKNNKSNIILFLFINPITILITNYIFKGYQMFNVFPFILLFFIIIKNSLTKIKLDIGYIKNIKFIFMLYVYALISIISTYIYTSNNITNLIYWFLIIIASVTFIFVLSLINLKITNLDFEYIIKGIFLLFCILSMACIFRMIIIGIREGDINRILTYKRIYSYPTMSNSNYTIAIISILFIYILNNMDYLTLKYKIISYAIMCINLLLAQSRGNLIALMVVILFYLLYKFIKLIKKNKIVINMKKIILFYAVLIVIFCIFIFIVKYKGIDLKLFSRIEAIFSGNDTNVSSRILYWREYIKDYSNFNVINLLFGRGLSNQLGLVVRPHNIFILILNQLGLVGLMLFLYSTIQIALKYRRLFYIILYLFIHSLTEPLFFTVWIDNIFIMLIFLEVLKSRISICRKDIDCS